MTPSNRPPRRVAVYCGSAFGNNPAYLTEAKALGKAIAAAGLGLVYGGASVGLMGAVADAALAGGADVIDHCDHVPVLGASIGFDEDAFINLVRQFVFYFVGQRFRSNDIGIEVHLPIAHDGHDKGIFPVGFRHFDRIIGLRHGHANALLEHWRDDHEDDQQHKHDVHHRSYVDIRVDLGHSL